MEVFKRDGVQNCRIDDIARIAEVSRAAFYFHFPTKDAVLLQLLGEGDELLDKALDTLPPDFGAVQMLECINAALVSFWKDRRELLPDAYGAGLRAMGTVQDLEQFGSRARVAQLFRKLQERGLCLKDFPAEVWSESFLNASMIAMIGAMRHPEQPLDQLMKRGAALFYRAIRPD